MIMAKYCIWRQFVGFWRHFETTMCNHSTHAANSVLSTAFPSTLIPLKSIRYAQLGSGSNILRDNIEKPVFAVTCRFWPKFERKMCVLSTQSAIRVLSTARQFDHTPNSTFGMVEPWSGRGILEDNRQKPHFEAMGGNRRNLSRKHAFSRPSLQNQFYRLNTIVAWDHRR